MSTYRAILDMCRIYERLMKQFHLKGAIGLHLEDGAIHGLRFLSSEIPDE